MKHMMPTLPPATIEEGEEEDVTDNANRKVSEQSEPRKLSEDLIPETRERRMTGKEKLAANIEKFRREMEEGIVGGKGVSEVHEQHEKKEYSKYLVMGTYTATEDTEITITKGEVVEVIEMDPSGWWFVRLGKSEGWAPSTFMKANNGEKVIESKKSKAGDDKLNLSVKEDSLKVNGSPARERKLSTGKKEKGKKSLGLLGSLGLSKDSGKDNKENINEDVWVTLASYQDSDEGMLNFKKGQELIVIERDDNGWWLARSGSQSGWVPSNYLKKRE